MTTSALVQTRNDIFHIDILTNNVNLNHVNANRYAPKYDNMNITTNEYREFLEDFSFTANEAMKWMNSVILRGNRVRFPFKMDQI